MGAAMTRYEAIEKALRACAEEMALAANNGFMDDDYHEATNSAQAALALPEDSKTVNAELYGLAVELADFRAKQFAEVSSDPIMRESKYCKDALRYLSLREASGEPMPYKVVRDGDRVRFE